MSIFKSTIQVNSGNTGWTRQHVMDALETAFNQLGFNGGSSTAGSPVFILPPGRTAGDNPGFLDNNWRYCGGAAITARTPITRFFNVTANGTSSYSVLEQWFPSSVSVASDTLTFTKHILNTGDPLVFNPGGAITGTTISPLVNDIVYYVIKVDSNTIKLATTLDDATNGTAINITATTGTTSNLVFRRQFNVLYNNYQIDVEMGDTLNFTVDHTGSSGAFYFIDSPSTGYASNRELSTTNFEAQSYQVFPTGQGTSNPSWQTRGWPQTETENQGPQDISGTGINPGSIRSYGYGNSVNSSMKGEIRILPACMSGAQGYTDQYPYWKYTVPASGGRSSLKLKIYRRPYQQAYSGSIACISIQSIGSGWGGNETFTIPGSAIGGVDTTNDITFGVNSATTLQQTNGTGVCTILTTNYGSGSTMYQKHPSGYYGVLKMVNDNTKTFGTTYYGFGLSSNNYRMFLTSGPMWITLNTLSTNSTNTDGQSQYGFYGGDRGLDYQEGANYITTSDTGYTYIDYATTATPTAYPLSIRIYKAQSPQDTNFAIIQFTQTINNAVIPFGTFTIHKGSGFGANVWDLNYVWNGGYVEYSQGGGTGRGINFSYNVAENKVYAQNENANNKTLLREANYGYLRNSGSYYGSDGFGMTRYDCNIDTFNRISDNNNYSYNSMNQVVTYYRNNTYDTFQTAQVTYNYADRQKAVSSSANYYKPMKGIPISQQLLPCPYYLPDDFILLQVSTSPGLTEFRPGDTVTISPSEVYEIILAGYQTQQNGLDNINNNSSIGMLFCARTT